MQPASPTFSHPIVMLHGAGHDHHVWDIQTHTLKVSHPIFAIDLPGHGATALTHGTPIATIEAYATHVMDWIERHTSHPLILIGHSMGSFVALEVASRLRFQISGLILAGTSSRLRITDRLLHRSHVIDGTMADPDLTEKLSQTGFAGDNGEWVRPPYLTRLRSVCKEMLERAAPGVLHSDFLACNAYTRAEEAALSVTAPCLVISGALDMMTPAKSAQPLINALRAEATTLAGAGHLMMQEAPETFNHAVTAFLKTLE